MTIEKTKIRLNILQEIGNLMEDALEKAKNDKLRTEGAFIALKGVYSNIDILKNGVNSDLDNKKIPDIETAKLVKTYITRSQNTCVEASERLKMERQQIQGKVNAFQSLIGHLKKRYDLEARKMEIAQKEAALKQDLEKEWKVAVYSTRENLEESLTGNADEKGQNFKNPKNTRHPGPTLKQQRLQTKKHQEEKISVDKPQTPSEETSQNEEYNPIEEIKQAQKASQRADGRFQCGSCRRHFKNWGDLVSHCAEEGHTTRPLSTE